MRGVVVLFFIALLSGTTGCSMFSATECREPLTSAQCEEAVADARAFVQANPDLLDDLVANHDVGAIRYSMVWTCGTDDASCHRDQPGLGWVRLVDADGHSPGAVVVCVEDSICASQEPSGLVFP